MLPVCSVPNSISKTITLHPCILVRWSRVTRMCLCNFLRKIFLFFLLLLLLNVGIVFFLSGLCHILTSINHLFILYYASTTQSGVGTDTYPADDTSEGHYNVTSRLKYK